MVGLHSLLLSAGILAKFVHHASKICLLSPVISSRFSGAAIVNALSQSGRKPQVN
jgi:hypothetical protein